jgi:hypothetical protein
MIYDIIGDIHGHAEQLKALLHQLGYKERKGVHVHSDKGRRAVFLGDFIDRGPSVPETLRIVREMTEKGGAYAVMGNHEYNAICFHTPSAEDRPGANSGWLRSRSDKHIFQHIETLYQFREDREDRERLPAYIEWFKMLPLFLDFPGFRVVHAAWVEKDVDLVRRYSREGNLLTSDFLFRSAVKGTEEHRAIEHLLKGVRLDISPDKGFRDKDGNFRTTMRTRWWEDARGKTYSDLGFPPGNVLSLDSISPEDADRVPGYRDGKPVFIGHYWLKNLPPVIQTPQICCLDYSVAKDGALTAYTYRGEEELNPENLTWVK